MNINRDYVSLETKFCSVCVFLIATPSKVSHSYSTFPFASSCIQLIQKKVVSFENLKP